MLQITDEDPAFEKQNHIKDERQKHGSFYTWVISKTNWKQRAIFLAIVASLIAGIRLACLFQALKFSNLGSTSAIMQGNPLIVMIIGHFFLKDKITLIRGFSAISLIVGIVLSAIPDNITSTTFASKVNVKVALTSFDYV